MSINEGMDEEYMVYIYNGIFSSVQLSHSVIYDFLRPHESQHAGPPCPSPTPRVYPNSCPSSRWCHPVILSSIAPFSSCPQSLPSSGSYPMSQLFAWGGQSIGVSASASVIKRNAFESVVMRLMNLESIIHSEISQKEKDKYCILMHIYRI